MGSKESAQGGPGKLQFAGVLVQSHGQVPILLGGIVSPVRVEALPEVFLQCTLRPGQLFWGERLW